MSLEGVESRLFATGWLARLWTGYAPALSGALRQAVAEHDLVHIHELWHYPHYAAYRAARATGRPYVVTVHGALNEWALGRKSVRKGLYMRVVQRRILQRASAVQVFTEAEAQRAHALGLTVPIMVIPNGVDVESYESLPPTRSLVERFPELRGKRVVLFLGRVHPGKGLDLLVRAFGDLARSHPDARLVVAGQDEGGYQRQVEGMLREVGTLDTTVFAGLLTGADKLEAMALADVFALPSYSEGFSMAILEAMAASLPVVISDQCAFPEVADAGAGLVVTTEAEQVREALARLLDSPKTRREMGQRGRRLVLERYTWERVAERVRQLYHDVLHQSLARPEVTSRVAGQP